MKRSIPFEAFAPNQYIYFDIARMAAVERETGQGIVTLLIDMEDRRAPVSVLTALLRHGLAHHYRNKPGVIEKVIDQYHDDGNTIIGPEVMKPLLRAVLASGLMGKEIADKAILGDIEEEPEQEKNETSPTETPNQ